MEKFVCVETQSSALQMQYSLWLNNKLFTFMEIYILIFSSPYILDHSVSIAHNVFPTHNFEESDNVSPFFFPVQ